MTFEMGKDYRPIAEQMNVPLEYGSFALRDEYQIGIHIETIMHCRKTNVAAFIEASVGAGKTINIGFMAKYVADKGGKVLVLARQGELVEQNSDEAFRMGCNNSIYSASLGMKSTFYPVVMGTEGTVYRALKGTFSDWMPDFVMVDECLTGDTLISTENGKLRINDPDLVNHRIYCVDEDSGRIKLDYPVRVFSNGIRETYNLVLSDANFNTVTECYKISCTDNHKFHTNHGWKEAKDLDADDVITLSNCSAGKLVSFTPSGKHEEVFDIEMPEHHNFFANDILAHNCHMVDWKDVSRYYMAKNDGAIPAKASSAAVIDETKTDKEIKRAKEIQAAPNSVIYHERTDKVYPESQYGRILVHFMEMNPKLRIIGYTGSPFRGKEPIKDKFWKEKIAEVDTMTLVSMGYLVPPVFGFGDDRHKYDLSEFQKNNEFGTDDYSLEDLKKMEKKITQDQSMTQAIMDEVIQRTSDRNGVLITCSGKVHCKQVADCLPEGSWGIVTDSTKAADRRAILNKAKSGEIKYVIQIGCLTTGVNVPIWDTCVMLRKIGSLTLLIQLIGRVLRILKDDQYDEGLDKRDGLVLDYAGTLEDMGDIYDNPVLNRAKVKLITKSSEYIVCPECEGHNSVAAVRCMHEDEDGDRCQHYFKFKECPHCETKNAPTAETCRSCKTLLIDPSQRLINKAYTEDEFKKVKSVEFIKCNNNALMVKWHLDSTMILKGKKQPEVAVQFFHPNSTKSVPKRMWKHFVFDHIQNNNHRMSIMRMNVDDVIRNKSIFEIPTHITHRLSASDKSVIAKKKWLSER